MPVMADIARLIKQNESETLEFKRSFGRESIESLVAFANTGGGTLLIGVTDDGDVCGVTVGRKRSMNGSAESSRAPVRPLSRILMRFRLVRGWLW